MRIMDKIIIKKIVSPTKEILDITTRWMYEWWGVDDNYKYDDVYTYMKNSFNKEKLPQTFIMYLDDKIIGMYQITYRDLFIRPDVYPWIANVYIDSRYRKKGYGKILIDSIKEQVKDNTTLDRVFLYTDHKNLYEKYGWQLIETIDDKNKLYKLNIR